MRFVLVPGLLNDAALFRDQIGPLSQVCDPVVADITQGTTLTDLAEAVLAIGSQQFALAGFSLGGIVAQEVMRIAPERVSHLALMDTTMNPDSPERAGERRYLIELAQNPGRFHGFGEKLLERYLAPEHIDNAVMGNRIREMTARLGPEVFLRQSLIPRPDNHAVLGTITVPTLVLCGEYDQLTPPSVHREMASLIPTARLAVVKHAGHMTPIEAPDVVAVALQRLLTR